jgi:hypothetical protein
VTTIATDVSSFVLPTQDWSLDELCGVCAILKIPFVVIVTPHVLKDKGSVRLRSVFSEASGDGSGPNSNEQLVHIDNLVYTIRELSAENSGTIDEIQEEQTDSMTPIQGGGNRDVTTGKACKPAVECIYVDQDQFFSSDRSISKGESSNWKSIMKTMKSISQRGESFVLSMADSTSCGSGNLPVFAVADVSFWVLRDFGTCLMMRSENEQNATSAGLEIAEKHPKHKRVIKTLAAAIENFMKRNGYWVGSSGQKSGHHKRQKLTTILLYSKVDDRFDMATLPSENTTNASSDHQGRNSRKR